MWNTCIPPLLVIIGGPLLFILGMLAGRQQGKERCVKHVQAIVDQYGLPVDENNGDC